LKGKTVTGLQTFGKHLLIQFGEGLTLRIHFLMFGTYRFDQSKEAPIQLHLGFAKGEELNFYTCSLRFIEDDLDDVYDWRGDILNDAWDPALALKKLKAGPKRMICDALMDQDIFAGLGNIIKNEVLFRTKVHPESLVGDIPSRKRKELVKDVVDYAELFLEWRQEGTLKKHWQAHTKKICANCGGPLTKRQTGVGKRRSFFCENCQVRYS
jgi:endonuclease-8